MGREDSIFKPASYSHPHWIQKVNELGSSYQTPVSLPSNIAIDPAKKLNGALLASVGPRLAEA